MVGLGRGPAQLQVFWIQVFLLLPFSLNFTVLRLYLTLAFTVLSWALPRDW